jgi:hypothetical protein
MGLSYSEIAALENDFNVQCEEKGICWTDNEVMSECLNDFIDQCENGYEPEILLNGYGYTYI